MATVQSLATCTPVDTLSACRAAVAELERERVIAVDSEGVHLSITGPLTLLQVATAHSTTTPRATVFLFDVKHEPRMFKDGGLKRLLEDNSIVKVLHAAKSDAEALYGQFQVELHNVHDTQVAHQELQRSEGRRFPPRTKLSDVCSVYCPEKTALVDADKDYVVTKMNRTVGEYWANRPLTQEMINYAASDVIALIPEMYTAQKQLLEEKGLTETFQSGVERQLRSVKDPDMAKLLLKEELDMAASTLRDFVAKSPRAQQRLKDITDENVVEALGIVRLNEVRELDLPAVIRELKLEQIQARLDEIEQEVKQKGKDYDGHGACRQLSAFVYILDGHPMKVQAQRVLEQVNKLVLDDIRTKYTPSTPLSHLARYEKKIITRGLRPRGERDPAVNPMLCAFYWKIRMEELEEEFAKFKANPFGYQVRDGFVKVLKFYLSGNVPAALKSRGKSFLEALQNLGKVARPQSRPRWGREQEFGYDDYSYMD